MKASEKIKESFRMIAIDLNKKQSINADTKSI